MEQQRALNALEPYLALSKAATSPRAAADLITQATSAPQAFVFAELLQTPNIQALRDSPEYSPYLRLLQVFAWGTLTDYNAASNLPPLSPAQHQKLLLLSLLPLCTKPTTLSYSVLHSYLFPNTPTDDLQLESLITQAIYASLINAHLDPLHRVVRVTSVAPLRDLAPNSLSDMLTTLTQWETRCNDTLADIEAQIAAIKTRAKEDKLRSRKRLGEMEEAVTQATDAFTKKNGGRDADDGERGPAMNNGGNTGRRSGWGGIFGGRGGKRAAGGVGVDDDDEDIMDVDYDDAGGRGGLAKRGAKRQGRFR